MARTFAHVVTDDGVATLGKAELLDYFVDAFLFLKRSHCGGQTQFSGVVEGFLDSQTTV